MYDVIIVGMGISGITAGIYAKRAGLNVLMLEKNMPGGTLQKISKINNYPGFEEISGPDLAMNLLNQVNNLEIPYKIEEVININKKADSFEVITKKNTYTSPKVIVASGRKPRYLGLDDEEKLLGRGLSTCATCDGFLFKNKIVAVVGNGSSALSASLHLASLASKVYFLHRKESFNGERYLIDAVLGNPNIEVIDNVNIVKLNEENNYLQSIELDNKLVLPVSGLFIYIGNDPETSFLSKLDVLDEKGNILVNDECQTNLSGLYACGDCIYKDLYQLITAASEGAIAINSIQKENN